jgi:hypothetical protein
MHCLLFGHIFAAIRRRSPLNGHSGFGDFEYKHQFFVKIPCLAYSVPFGTKFANQKAETTDGSVLVTFV